MQENGPHCEGVSGTRRWSTSEGWGQRQTTAAAAATTAAAAAAKSKSVQNEFGDLL